MTDAQQNEILLWIERELAKTPKPDPELLEIITLPSYAWTWGGPTRFLDENKELLLPLDQVNREEYERLALAILTSIRLAGWEIVKGKK